MDENIHSVRDFVLRLREHKASNIIILFISVQLVLILGAVLFPSKFSYLSTINIGIITKGAPTLGVIALGVNLLMITGEFDLSVGSTFAFTALVMAITFDVGAPVWIAILLALVIGVVIGLINGVLVVSTGVPSFIITLGAMMFWRGMVLLVSGRSATSFPAPGYIKSIFGASFGPVSAQFIWFIGIALILGALLERHKLGNYFFAVGGNRETASALGINSARVKIIAFGIVGFLAALAGVLSTVRVGNISPIQGEGLELRAIAACVIGGTALMGGRGSVLGAFLGVLLMFIIEDVLLLLRAPGFFLQLFVGLIIIVAASLNEYLRAT